MSPLNRKLLRDLWRIKGQAVAIGAVIGVGVLMLVMMTGLVTSLDETRRTYYERYRLADVFASVNRAPEQLIAALGAIPGISAVSGRITGSVVIDLLRSKSAGAGPGRFAARLCSPRLNDIYITDGRRFENSRTDEIVLLQSFAVANDLHPGDTLSVTINGKRRILQIVGLAQAPEFLYTTPPGELVPDDGRFGIIWMSRTALAAAYDMDGAFNEALLAVGPVLVSRRSGKCRQTSGTLRGTRGLHS